MHVKNGGTAVVCLLYRQWLNSGVARGVQPLLLWLGPPCYDLSPTWSKTVMLNDGKRWTRICCGQKLVIPEAPNTPKPTSSEASPLWEITALLRPLADEEGALCPIPKNPIPTVGPWASTLS